MKVLINGTTIEFANRMSILESIDGSTHKGIVSNSSTIACIAFPKYNRVIMLEKSNKLGGSSKLAVYSAFEFFEVTNRQWQDQESVFNLKEKIKEKIIPFSSRYEPDVYFGYYYEAMNYEQLQVLLLDMELNNDVELFVPLKIIIVNPHEIITKFLRKYKLIKLNDSKG